MVTGAARTPLFRSAWLPCESAFRWLSPQRASSPHVVGVAEGIAAWLRPHGHAARLLPDQQIRPSATPVLSAPAARYRERTRPGRSPGQPASTVIESLSWSLRPHDAPLAAASSLQGENLQHLDIEN